MEYLESYRGVVLYKGMNRYFPYNARGVVWEAQTLDALRRYIDKALDTGSQHVNERGALMFK